MPQTDLKQFNLESSVGRLWLSGNLPFDGSTASVCSDMGEIGYFMYGRAVGALLCIRRFMAFSSTASSYGVPREVPELQTGLP